MPLFKRKSHEQQPSDPSLSRNCQACGHKASFDWALCPQCGALAGAAQQTSAEVITPTSVAQGSGEERARFEGQGNFYRTIQPAPADLDRTDPAISATIIERPAADEATLVDRGAKEPSHADRTMILRTEPVASPEAEAMVPTVIESATVEPESEFETEVEPAPEDEPAFGPLAFVVERSGPAAGSAHLLRAESVLGRSDEADIVVGNSAVSKRHARIRYENGAFVFWDLASSNFSFVVGPDGERTRILEPLTLKDGDTIDLADTRITFLSIDAGVVE